MKHILSLLALTLLVPLAGCGAPPPPVVSGTVTWKNAPLPSGDIIFSDPDGQVAPGAGKIVNGAYSFRVAPGKKKVEIHATREVPSSFDPVMQSSRREDYIPRRYNTQTKLTAEVTQTGDNSFPFILIE